MSQADGSAYEAQKGGDFTPPASGDETPPDFGGAMAEASRKLKAEASAESGPRPDAAVGKEGSEPEAGSTPPEGSEETPPTVEETPDDTKESSKDKVRKRHPGLPNASEVIGTLGYAAMAGTVLALKGGTKVAAPLATRIGHVQAKRFQDRLVDLQAAQEDIFSKIAAHEKKYGDYNKTRRQLLEDPARIKEFPNPADRNKAVAEILADQYSDLTEAKAMKEYMDSVHAVKDAVDKQDPILRDLDEMFGASKNSMPDDLKESMINSLDKVTGDGGILDSLENLSPWPLGENQEAISAESIEKLREMAERFQQMFSAFMQKITGRKM